MKQPFHVGQRVVVLSEGRLGDSRHGTIREVPYCYSLGVQKNGKIGKTRQYRRVRVELDGEPQKVTFRCPAFPLGRVQDETAFNALVAGVSTTVYVEYLRAKQLCEKSDLPVKVEIVRQQEKNGWVATVEQPNGVVVSFQKYSELRRYLGSTQFQSVGVTPTS